MRVKDNQNVRLLLLPGSVGLCKGQLFKPDSSFDDPKLCVFVCVGISVAYQFLWVKQGKGTVLSAFGSPPPKKNQKQTSLSVPSWDILAVSSLGCFSRHINFHFHLRSIYKPFQGSVGKTWRAVALMGKAFCFAKYFSGKYSSFTSINLQIMPSHIP